MHVRPATADDEAAIHEVHERAVRELAGEVYRDEVVEAWVGTDDDGEEESDESEDNPSTDEGSDDEHDEEFDDGQPANGRRFVAAVPVDEARDESGVEERTRVVGFGDVRFDPPEYLEKPADGGVRAVYVHPDYASRGVGSSLLERLEVTATEAGVELLGLHASVNAQPFYERHGYEVVSELTFEFGGEVEGPAVEMRKEL